MKQSILISIDCLFDTRLAVLDIVKPGFINVLLNDRKKLNAYLERFEDSYPELDLDTAKFRRLYRQRISALLPMSPLTALTYELKNMVDELVDISIDEPHRVSGIELVINTAPYHDLPRPVIDELIKQIETIVQLNIPIRDVYLPINELSPYMLKHSDYVTMFIYDIEEWLIHHYNPMVQLNSDLLMPQFTITAPMIVTSKEALKEATNFEAPNGETCDYFEGLAFTFKDLFKYDTMDAALFSMAHPGYVARHLIKRHK